MLLYQPTEVLRCILYLCNTLTTIIKYVVKSHRGKQLFYKLINTYMVHKICSSDRKWKAQSNTLHCGIWCSMQCVLVVCCTFEHNIVLSMHTVCCRNSEKIWQYSSSFTLKVFRLKINLMLLTIPKVTYKEKLLYFSHYILFIHFLFKYFMFI